MPIFLPPNQKLHPVGAPVNRYAIAKQSTRPPTTSVPNQRSH